MVRGERGLGLSGDSHIAQALSRLDMAAGDEVEAAARALFCLALAPSPPPPRRRLGLALASRPLPDRRRLLFGSAQNAGRVPGAVAARLAGRPVHSFACLRRALWRAVAASPHATEFTAADRAAMRAGRPPTAAPGQWVGRRRAYEVHHARPLHAGGAPYDLANLVLATPRYHISALAPRYHFGRPAPPLPPPPP